MSEPSLPVAPTGADNPLRVAPDRRTPDDGHVADLPLPAALLEPIGDGIASCPALWEPLAGHALAGPVQLFATDGYEVRLEAHPPGTRLEARRSGITHTVTAVRGALHLRPAAGADGGTGAGIAVLPGGTAVVATTTDVAIENLGTEVALAIHVRSAAAPAPSPSVAAAHFPAAVASMLSHPSRAVRSRRPAPDGEVPGPDRSVIAAVGARP
jgi:hypothetical protein